MKEKNNFNKCTFITYLTRKLSLPKQDRKKKGLLFSGDRFEIFEVRFGFFELFFSFGDLVLFGLYLLLHVLHGLGMCLWHSALMVTQNGHGPVGSVVGEEFVVDAVFSF